MPVRPSSVTAIPGIEFSERLESKATLDDLKEVLRSLNCKFYYFR